MAAVSLQSDAEAPDEARVVFEEIRKSRRTPHVNNFWRALAIDPVLMRSTWDRLQEVMASGALDPLFKEMIYVAVSSANGCGYCVHSHTAAAKAKGMTPAMHAELLAVIAIASQTNALATAMQVPVDEAFEAGSISAG